jgi:hypothetical protein
MATTYRLEKPTSPPNLDNIPRHIMNDRYAKAAEEELALMGTAEEGQGLGEPIPNRAKQLADSVFSLRLTKDEFKELRIAAEHKGLKISEVIRRGALEYARRDEDTPHAVAEVKKKVRELEDAIGRL